MQGILLTLLRILAGVAVPLAAFATVGLDLTLLVVAVAYIPAAIALHGAVFHRAVTLSPAAVARVVLVHPLQQTEART